MARKKRGRTQSPATKLRHARRALREAQKYSNHMHVRLENANSEARKGRYLARTIRRAIQTGSSITSDYDVQRVLSYFTALDMPEEKVAI